MRKKDREREEGQKEEQERGRGRVGEIRRMAGISSLFW